MLETPFNASDTFDTILDYYDLKKAYQHLLLYNKSKYKYGYHGIVHVRNACCTIVEISKQMGNETGLEYSLVRELLLAMIFHDINYIGGIAIRSGENGEPIFSDENYDDKNIQAAVNAVRCITYHDGPYIGLASIILPKITKAIESTRWPSKETDREKWDLVKTIMINADHSMVLYDDYIPLVVALFTNELGITDLEEARQASLDWLEHVQFDFHNLKEKWEVLKPELKETMTDFFDTCKLELIDDKVYLTSEKYEISPTIVSTHCGDILTSRRDKVNLITPLPDRKLVLKDSSRFISMANGYKYPFEEI